MSAKDYLDSLIKSGGAQASWAKSQMGKVPTPPTQNMAAAPTASFTAAPAVPKANVPTPPQYTQDQLSHQSWINNSASGQGGMDAYTAKQNQRWAEANEKGDNDLISRLQADSQRVGYALSPIQSKVPAPVPAPPTTATPSTPNMAYNVGTNADREAEAKRRMELALSEKRRISEQQKKGLMDSYGKLRTNINEDRSLENTQLQRRLNPFSGRSDYANAMVERERGRTDREMGQDLSTRLANVDELLANYENASETERQRIVDELTRQDRDFGLQQGQLTGNYNDDRTLAGSQFDWSKEMDVTDRTGYMGGHMMGSQGMGGGQGIMAGEWNGNASGAPFIPGMRTLQGQQFDRSIFESDRNYNYQVGRDQVGDQRYNQEFDYKKVRDSIQDQQYKQKFDEDVRRFGMEYALRNRDQALSSQRLAWERDPENPDNIYKRAQIDNLRSEVSKSGDKELEGLYTGLSSGQIDPGAAIDEINTKLSLGLYSPVQASKMTALIEQFSTTAPRGQMPTPTKQQIEQNNNVDYSSMSYDQLEKMWNSDPSGRDGGTPKIDWMVWMRDPRGKLAGVSFEAYQKARGPQLRAK